jgi:SNF2 family DNA or RNA helicase
MSSWELTDEDMKVSPPATLKLPLRPHQTTILYKCLQIEKNIKSAKFPYAFMCDKAGSGKTSVIISLILTDKLLYGRTQNLIVVPQNIHSQWIAEIKKFAGDELNVKSFIEYSDISTIFFDKDMHIEEYDILITTSLYYDIVTTAFSQVGIDIKRVVYDEIDSINNIIENLEIKKDVINKHRDGKSIIPTQLDTGSKTKITWFVSASINNMIDADEGFKFGNSKISIDDLRSLMVKCNDEYVDQSNIKLDEPVVTIIECEDIADTYHDLLSIDDIDSINSLNFQNIHSRFTGKIASNGVTALKNIMEDYFLDIKRIDDTLKALKKNKKMTAEIMDHITILETDKKFQNTIIESLHSVNCTNDCSDKLECFNETIDSLNTTIPPSKSKLAVFHGLMGEVNQTRDKVLVFSDFTGPFKILGDILTKKGIKYTELSGGNIKNIDASIDAYKNNDTVVMMIDSSTEGCGINLENTTKLIFLHRINDTLNNQVVGRAQRPGRTGVLKIYTLLNKNEVITK